MKKVYSTIMLFAMMVAALSITACSSSSDDDEDNGGGGSGNSGEKQVSVYLQQAGTLSSVISKTQASNLLRLKVSGHMDARDFDFIKWDCMNVEEVDLSEVIIDSYSGLEGTEEGNNKTYAANEIPSGAFFYWRDVHKYIYDGMPIEKGKESLKKVVLPQGITAIRRNAFAGAINLTKINIPDGVESIDFVAFAICTSLEEIKLPASLNSIGKQAFAGMTNIKRFYVDAQTPPSALNDSFDGIPSDAVLYVPNGTENLYKYASGWRYFSNIVGYGDNSNDEEEWQMVTDDFDRGIPFKKIRILNRQANNSVNCCISFSTSPTESIDSHKFFINFWTLTIGDNVSNSVSWGNPISSYNHVGDNWYEYEFSRPVYFAYYQENCPRGQVMAYIENKGGGDDGDEIDGGGSASSFSITYDGEKNYVENVEWLNPHFGNGGYNKGNYFCLEDYPLNGGQIHIIFPYSKYGKNVPPSYFQVGYSDFGEDATDIEYITTSMAGWHGEYVSGSAKVVKNSGSSITLQFSSYKFEVSRSGKTHEFILNGTLEFENYMYD